MKVVVFGCQQIAVDFITFLRKKNVTISLIITYELLLDKTYGYESVIEKFSDSEIEVLNPNRVNINLINKIKLISPDIIFSVYYRKILPKSLLGLPKLGCINIHPSLLPSYRGPVPTAWAIQNGETNFGITIHYMDEGIDTGDILVQEKYPINDNETGYELYTKAMKLGAKLLEDNFENIINKKLKPIKQNGKSSYYGKKTGKYNIDWNDSAKNINNKIRVHAKPFNPAEASLFNRYFIINKASIVEDEKYTAQGSGLIVDIIQNKIIVSCAEGCLLLEDYSIVPELNDLEKKIYLKIGNKFD
tara:strand:- start:5482 stop:6390 length:909 start_codon:yes stop_codon:yes gene_type:complete